MQHHQLRLVELEVSRNADGGDEIDETSQEEPEPERRGRSSATSFILSLVSGRASPPFENSEPALHHLLRNCLTNESVLKLSLILHTSVHPRSYESALEVGIFLACCCGFSASL